MKIVTEYLNLSTHGDTDIIDITPSVSQNLKSSKLKNGIVNLNVIGSTGALTTCEYEPGLVKDLKEAFEKLIPQGKRYHHDEAWPPSRFWRDGEPRQICPPKFINFGEVSPNENSADKFGGQQIIFIDFDNRPRERKIVLQFLGE